MSHNVLSLFYSPGPDPKPKLRGDTRTFRVWLDPNQYQQDMTSSIQNATEDPYESFNIIMRRKPKENNFKVSRGTVLLLITHDPDHLCYLNSLNIPPSPPSLLSFFHTTSHLPSIHLLLPPSFPSHQPSLYWSIAASRRGLDLFFSTPLLGDQSLTGAAVSWSWKPEGDPGLPPAQSL